MDNKLTPKLLRDMLPANQWFGVTFVKKSTGLPRKMAARLGVRKHLRGGPPAYNSEEKGLLTVWDRNAKGAHGPKDAGYRAIPVDNITELRTGGYVHTLIDSVIVSTHAR